MYIITRYVVWEVLSLFLAALFAMTLVFTLTFGLREGFKEGLPASVMFMIMPFMLPQMLGMTIPVSILFAVCSVFGRMTGCNEVVALKSLGISPMAIVWPAIVLAIFLSLGTVWMYELAATWCGPKKLQIAAESFEEIIYGMLQTNRSIALDQFAITVKRLDGRKMIQPTIVLKSQKITIAAAEAELRTDPKTHSLEIICRDSTVDVEGAAKYTAFVPGETSHPVPVNLPRPDRYHRDWVAMRDIPLLVAELEATLRPLEGLRAAGMALGIEETKDDAEKIAEYRRLILRLRTESYRRWANGFTCLFFSLLGIPVAMIFRHSDVLTNFFVCFLPILVLYYPLLMFGEDLSCTGKLPPISFWMGNAVLAVPAIILLRRIVKH